MIRHSARAVGFREFGGPEVLDVVAVDVPEPGPDDVVVRVAAATVNPVDLKMRSGAQSPQMAGLEPPYVAGMDFAGHVHSLGSAVRGLAEGDAVMGVVRPWRPEGGAHAEYVCAPAASVTPRIGGIDLASAATVPMNGLTAAVALDVLSLPAGAMVLVTGGPGAVGGYAIQLAKNAGLEVVADAHEQDCGLVAQLGADHIVPRGAAMAEAVHDIRPDGVEGAVDAARLGDMTGAAVQDGGLVVDVAHVDTNDDGRVRRRHITVLQDLTNTSQLDRLGELTTAGRLTARVAHVVPFSDAARAHRLVEAGGLRGRAVLTFDGGLGAAALHGPASWTSGGPGRPRPSRR